MSIVATEIDYDTGGSRRLIYYRCQDSSGVWHQAATVITTDPNFDAVAHKAVVAAQVQAQLELEEFRAVVV